MGGYPLNTKHLRDLRSWEESRRQGSGFLDAIPVPACVIDRSGAIRAANQEWKEVAAHNQFLPGTRPSGSGYFAWCDQMSDAQRLRQGIADVLAGRQPSFTLECSPRELPERTFRLRVTQAPHEYEEGAVLALVEVRRSPAPRRSDELSLQAQKMEAVGRLAGGVAHDFNNLLTLISGYTEILLGRLPAGDISRQEIEEIRKAANRGASLTAQLLHFSRRQKVEPRPLDLNQLVSDMERMLRRMIGEDIQLAAELSPRLGRINADPGQIGQILMNLVLNARDAMPRGGRIAIRTANVEVTPGRAHPRGSLAPGRYVRLDLEDSGAGMSEETLQHLFEPFYTTKAPGRGTGLGLSTVYGVVKQSGGDIWVESELNRGSTFSILLPAVDAAPEPEPEREPHPAGGTETILVVEDEPSVRRLLRHVLVKHGYTVLEADSGEQALEVYNNYGGRVHLLLTDMVMPRMNGRELADHLTGLQEDLRVLYISGYTDDVLLRNGSLGPGMAFLQKPLKPVMLAAKVREVLDPPPHTAAENAQGSTR